MNEPALNNMKNRKNLMNLPILIPVAAIFRPILLRCEKNADASIGEDLANLSISSVSIAGATLTVDGVQLSTNIDVVNNGLTT